MTTPLPEDEGGTISLTKELILAMAPIKEVIEAFINSCVEGHSFSDFEEQERFGELVTTCKGDFSPSERYLKTLIKYFVYQIERDEAVVESDTLAELVYEASVMKDKFPEPSESSYLSFFLPSNDKAEIQQNFLRIREYPYHNDVSLRLWEAGACLGEFFLANKGKVAMKRVVELGAGVGLTGFVIAGCCGAKSVHMTDYTDACLLNLAHNILINNGWLSRAGIKENITQGYLEWTEFLVAENAATTKEKAPDTNMVKLREADLLIAADVIYDVSVIEALVAVIQTFLSENPEKKEVIHAITKRNLKTFEIFLQHLKNYNIRYDWIADGRYCANLPNAFKCNFNQPWSDIQIASLKIQS